MKNLTNYLRALFKAAPVLPMPEYPAPAQEGPPWEPFDGPLERIPKGRKEAYQIYGNPGVGKVDPRWEEANMVVARNLPGTWNNGSKKLYTHRLVEPYLREALRRAEIVAPGYIKQLGCFNFRHQRHDPSRPLSYHSFGCALDINPKDNDPWQVAKDHCVGKRTGPLSELFSLGWYTTWKRGIPKEVVNAFESVGWKWGGRWHPFCDPMHFELVA